MAWIVIFLLVVNLAGVFWYASFIRGLRERHEATWTALHRPGITNPDDSRRGHPLLEFFLRGEFRSLGDQELTRLGNRVRIVMIVTLISILAAGLISLAD